MTTIGIHKMYNKYECDAKTGLVRFIGRARWLTGTPNRFGYLGICVKGDGMEKAKYMFVHRLIWECFNGPIEEGKEIDHIDGNKKNNVLSNLQCITVSENRRKRNHDFLKKIGQGAHDKKEYFIKSRNLDTNEEHIFKTKTACARFFKCSPALIYLICEKKNGIEKFNNNIFEYTKDEPNTFWADPRIGTKRVTEEEQKKKRKEVMKKYYNKKKQERLLLKNSEQV